MTDKEKLPVSAAEKVAIVDFLKRRLSIGQEQGEALPDEVIAALRDDPRAGIGEVLKAVNRKEIKGNRLMERAGELRRALRDVRDSTRGKITETVRSTVEASPENTEAQRVDAALEEARRMGLVDIRDIGDPKAERRGIVIGSGHYAVERNATPPSPDVKKSQYQMFALADLLRKHGVLSTLYVEGVPRGVRPHANIMLTFPGGRRVPVQSAEAQDHFVRHPSDFVAFLEQRRHDGLPATFYEVTSFQRVEGAHKPAVFRELNWVVDNLGISNDYYRDYRDPRNPTIDAQVVDGRWKIFINNRWVEPEKLYADSVAFLHVHERLEALSETREREVSDLFDEVAPGSVPMAWVGLHHVDRIAKICADRGQSARLVTAAATRGVSTGGHDIRTVTQLRDYAASIMRRNA